MKITDKEYQVLAVLWESETPMTAAEIVESSDSPMWKEKSIHIILNSLINKGVVVTSRHKPTGTNNAKTYSPTCTWDDCFVSMIENVKKIGVKVDESVLARRLLENMKR